MPRIARGTTFISGGAIYASVTVAPRRRLARAIPFLRVDDQDSAQAWASALQELVNVLRNAGRDAEIEEKVDVAVQTGRDDPKAALTRVRAGIAKLRAKAAPTLIAAT